MGVAVFLFITVVILTAVISSYYMFPQEDFLVSGEFPKAYFIESLNRIDIQQNNFECAAFSSAYLIRHFGIETDGNELYRHFPKKLFSGIIAPKGIIIFFKRLGYRVSFCKGNINSLKKQISIGVPVIAFIKVFPDKEYLHFVPVVGYDEEYLYFADSLKYTINCNERYYNRKTPISDFEALWRTRIPFYKNTYIVASAPRTQLIGATEVER